MPTSPLQETYLNGREKVDELGSDINEYTRVLYGVSHVLKNRGFNYSVNDLSNLFHSPLASIRASEQIEQIIKGMDATFADGLKRGKDSNDTTKAIDISTLSWRTNRLYSAQNHDPLNDVDGLIADFLKNKFPGIRRGTKQWKEESAKLADKALKAARDNKKNNINRELLEFKSWWDKDGQKLINTAEREADHTETQMKLIYALNPDSKAIQEAEEQIKSIRSRIINFQSSGNSSIKKAEEELLKLSEVQEVKKEIEKGETVEVVAEVIKENVKVGAKSKYFRNVQKEYDDRSGYYNVHEPVEKAHPFTYKGIEMFVAKGVGLHPIWNVTEVKTGLLIPGEGKTKEAAIEAAKKTIDRFTHAKINEMIATSAKRMEKEGIKEYVEEPEVKEIKKELEKKETVTVPSSFLKALKPVVNKETKMPNYGTYNKGGRTQTGIVSYDYYEVEPNPPKDLQYQGTRDFHGGSASLMFSKSTGKTYINPANTKEYLTHIRYEKSEREETDLESARFGEKVTVTADPDNPDVYPSYSGTIIRTLNKGQLIEVRPEGQIEGSFRVDANRVVPLQEIAEIKKDIAKGETVEVPEQVISETVSGSGKQFIGKRAKHSEFGEVLVVWQNPTKNRALIQFDDGEKQETQMHKLRLLPPPEKEIPVAVKEEIKQGETVTIPETVLKEEIQQTPPVFEGIYTYYFRNRPPDIGTHPGYAITTVTWIPKKETPNGNMAWGYVTYDHKLSTEELSNFELFVDDIEMPAKLKDLVKFTHDEGIDEAMKEVNAEYDKIILNWMKANKRYPASRQKEAIRAELMQLAGITEKDSKIPIALEKEIKQGETVIVPAEAIESTPETDWNYALKKQLKVEQDERKKTYPTVEAFRTSRTKQADLLSTDFHLKSYKEKAEKYKPGTIQYNKHMAEYKARLEEIAELRREAEAGKTIHELKLEETMRQNDEQFAEKRSQEDIEQKRDERLRNTDTETLKQLAYTANIAWTNDKLSWKERHAAKDEGRAVLDILKERGIDISQDLIAKKLPDVKEIKQELTKGETVTIPESVLKATVGTEPNDIEKSKYTYPLSPEEIKENELSGGIEIHNIGGPSKLNSKGQIIGSTDLGQIRLKNGKYYTEYQGKEGWVRGLTFDNYIHAHRYVLDKSGYKPIIDIKKDLAKGETITVPESVIKGIEKASASESESKWEFNLWEKAHDDPLSIRWEIPKIGGGRDEQVTISWSDKRKQYETTFRGKNRQALPELKGFKDIEEAKRYAKEYMDSHQKGSETESIMVERKANREKTEEIVKEIRQSLKQEKTVTVPEPVLKATIDTEPSAEVKEWFDKAHGIKDYKGGRNDRRSILSMLINAMPYGNVKSFNDMAKMAKAIGKDLGYGEATSGTWERHFAEQIANETGRDVSIIGNAMVVHPGNKQSLKLPDGSLKPMSESKKLEAKKPVEEPKHEIEAKEKIDTGDAVLDELLEQSNWLYRAGRDSKLRPEARKYTQAVYDYLLHGGDDPEIPVILKPHSTDSTDEYIVLDSNLKSLFNKAVIAAKKTRSLQKKEINAVKSELSTGSTAVVPETILKKDIVSDAENQRRVDLMNERIKTERTLNVGVFHDGKLIKGGFKNAYDARNFMNDSFFTGSRANKINLLNPADFGWKVELIDEKTEILNIDELKQISKGATVTIPESALKAATKKELTFEEVGAIVEREMSGKRISAKALKDYIEKKHSEGMPRGWVETHYLRVNPPTTTELEKDINKIEKQLEKTYHTVTSRAQATTREAQSGKLAQVLEGKKTQLKGIIEEKIVKGATAIVPEMAISTLGKGTGIANYFTFDKAKGLITTMPATLSDSDLQKKSVIISDYIRLMESSDPYAREQLVKGGYWAGVADPGGTGKTPRDISMHTNLKYMQGLFDKELSVRKQKKEVTLGKIIAVPESQLNPEFKGYGLFIKYTGSKDYRLMLSFPKENDAINAGYHYQSGKRELRNRITSWLVKDEKQNIVKLVTDGETQIIQTEIAKGKTIIKPESSAHIGALVTISGTKEEALRAFDRLLRRGQTVEVPQRNFIRLIEPPRLQIAAPAPSGIHAISVYSAPVIQLLHKGEVIDLPESSFRKIIDMPKPDRMTGSKKQKPSCIPPVRVRAYNRGCPIKRR